MPRLRRSLTALFVTAPLLAAPAASAASISIVLPDGAVEDSVASLTITGTVEAQRTLYAYAIAESKACASAAAAQDLSSGGLAITPTVGVTIGTGPFNRPTTFTPSDDGRFRICAYLSESASSVPTAFAQAVLAVATPTHAVTASLEPTTYEPGETLRGRVTASSPVGGRELQYGWSGTSGDCSTWTGSPVTVPLTPGATVERTSSVNATSGAQSYRLCAAIIETAGAQREASVEAVSSALPRDALLARWRPVLLTPDGDEQEDRLRLRWQTRAESAGDETLEIWDEDPADGADPVLSEPVDNDEMLELMDSPDGQQDARIRNFLGFRQFWWSVGTSAPGGEIAWSETRTVTVVPSPMKKKRVRVSTKFTPGYSTKRPGWIRLRVQSSPRARVTVQIFHRGRLFKREKYIEGVGRLRGFDYAQSCSRQGVFSYVVRMRDPYGTKVVKKGSWTTSPSRCASLRAKEQRKAAAEARKRREREERRRGGSGGSGGSGGGGSNCHPSYSPQCLKTGIGDYDCSGGSGDGPNYVTGPVYVSGSDPFDLDRDGDGVGCEG